MTDVSFTDLVLRMVVSLAVVLAIVLGAYAVMRRKQGFRSSFGSSFGASPLEGAPTVRQRSTKIARTSSSKVTGSKRGLRVVGRIGIGRTTQVVAVQFAEKVFLLGASEHTAPSILAELDLDAWLDATESDDGSGSGSVRRVPHRRHAGHRSAARSGERPGRPARCAPGSDAATWLTRIHPCRRRRSPARG